MKLLLRLFITFILVGLMVAVSYEFYKINDLASKSEQIQTNVNLLDKKIELTDNIEPVKGEKGDQGQQGLPGTVTGYEIVTNSKIVTSGNTGTVEAFCPTGKKVSGIGCFGSNGSPTMFQKDSVIYGGGNGGNCSYYNGGFIANTTINIQLVCVVTN